MTIENDLMAAAEELAELRQEIRRLGDELNYRDEEIADLRSDYSAACDDLARLEEQLKSRPADSVDAWICRLTSADRSDLIDIIRGLNARGAEVAADVLSELIDE